MSDYRYDPPGCVEMLAAVAIVGENTFGGEWTGEEIGTANSIAEAESTTRRLAKELTDRVELAEKVISGQHFDPRYPSDLFEASGSDGKGNLDSRALKAKVRSGLPALKELRRQALEVCKSLNAAIAQLCQLLGEERVQALVVMADDGKRHHPPAEVWRAASATEIVRRGWITWDDEAGKTIDGTVWIPKADLFTALATEGYGAVEDAPASRRQKPAAKRHAAWIESATSQAAHYIAKKKPINVTEIAAKILRAGVEVKLPTGDLIDHSTIRSFLSRCRSEWEPAASTPK